MPLSELISKGITH